MPTLPMYAHPADANAWHGGFAPGGYELWRFNAEDTAADRRIVATLYDGDPADAAYRRSHARYRRNPTRVDPVFPRDCRGVRATVYRGERMEFQMSVRIPPELLIATPDPARIALGGSVMEVHADGPISLQIGDGRVYRIDLQFCPAGALAPIRQVSDCDRYFVSSEPYLVKGTVGGEAFAGRGDWEHAWGALSYPMRCARQANKSAPAAL